MLRVLLATASVIALSGCNTTTGVKVLDNLQGCERHYDGAISAGVIGGAQFTGTIKVNCSPNASSKPPET